MKHPTDRYKIAPQDYLPLKIIVLLPTLFWVFAAVRTFDIPHHAYDPEYIYFLTSLKPFVEGGYTYIQPPGTPLQALGTLLLALTYPFLASRPEGFIGYHLANPIFFLIAARFILLVASIGTALLFYSTLRSESRAVPPVWAMAFSMLYYVLHSASFFTLTYWSHNSLNFPLGTLYLLILYRVVRENKLPSLRQMAGLGLFAGFLAAIVIYLSTWMLGTLVVLLGIFHYHRLPWKKMIQPLAVFLGAGIAGFVLGISPILSRFPVFRDWIIRVLSHQGRYGTGEQGFTSLPVLLENVSALTANQPILFAFFLSASLLFSILVLRRGISLNSEAWLLSLGLGVFAQMLVVSFLILKHPSVHNYYLYALAASLPVFIWLLIRIAGFNLAKRPSVSDVVPYGIMIWVFVSMVVSGFNLSERTGYVVTFQDKVPEIVQEYADANGKDAVDVRVVFGYGVFDNCTALTRINNNYTRVFSNEIAVLCPNLYVLNDTAGFRGHVISVDGKRSQLTVSPWDMIIVRESSVSAVLSLLATEDVAVKNLDNVKTSFPGYRPDENISIITPAP